MYLRIASSKGAIAGLIAYLTMATTIIWALASFLMSLYYLGRAIEALLNLPLVILVLVILGVGGFMIVRMMGGSTSGRRR